MARRVADLRAAFEVLAGPSWRDPWSVPAPLRGPEPAKPIRVALVVDPAGQGTADQVQDGVRKAARALEDAGYAVEEVEPPSIDVAAKTLLDMLNTPDIRAVWQLHVALDAGRHPAVPVGVLRGGRRSGPGDDHAELHDSAVAAAGLGRVPGTAPADRGPDLHRHSLRGGHRPGRRPGGRDHPRHAHGHRRQRPGTARRGASRGHRRTGSRRRCR